MGFLDGIIETIGGGITGGGLLGLGGSIISGMLGSEGQEDTNQANQQIAQNNNAFNAEQAERTRQYNSAEAAANREWAATRQDENNTFQKDMSNTQIRRRVADLSAAGLNPMLAYSDGASSPSGGIPSSSAASSHNASAATPLPMHNVNAAGMQSAANAAQIRNSLSQSDVNEAQVENTKAETIQRIASAGHLNAMKDNIRQEMQSFTKRMERLSYNTAEDENKWRISNVEQYRSSHIYNMMRELTEAARDKIVAEARKLQQEAKLVGLKIPEAVREAAFFTSADGAPAMYFRHAPKNFTSAWTGATGAIANDIQRGFKLNQGR